MNFSTLTQPRSIEQDDGRKDKVSGLILACHHMINSYSGHSSYNSNFLSCLQNLETLLMQGEPVKRAELLNRVYIWGKSAEQGDAIDYLWSVYVQYGIDVLHNVENTSKVIIFLLRMGTANNRNVISRSLNKIPNDQREYVVKTFSEHGYNITQE